MNAMETKDFERAIAEITEIASGFGLDFYSMRYEICPVDTIYAFGAYAMPTRFSHWSFGKQYQKMKLQYDYGLGKIYELVINSDPCYAYLLNTNSLTQNKMIVAHVLAHSDFFKNNIRFINTRRDMAESMNATSKRIREFEQRYGQDEVEHFINAVLSINEHIDPTLNLSLPKKSGNNAKVNKGKPYADLALVAPMPSPTALPESESQQNPKKAEKDLLKFLHENSPVLADWQRDILATLREEMLYFWPQLETKIMNEGWASYWHAQIMRELDLTTDEAIDFAKLNADIIQPLQKQMNPYRLGLKIFEDIERRYDQPTEDMQKHGVRPHSGRAKLFEVRELESDISFIRNYLTHEIVANEDLFMYKKVGDELKITSKDFAGIRDELIHSRLNGGYPYIVVTDSNYQNKGELYLKHDFEGTELDLNDLEKVLHYLYELWGSVVNLETRVEDHQVIFSCDGTSVQKKRAE
ncbi:stage V sporulation protein R [Pullulanibacillus camelliae]|uniref:Stage V sporulation protein R n=1 Tax=Pullulanibacillus camelliae TaxID=1707096 RepID=A0A8J2YHY2_9BACL|nr:SpoVR family protein [Pullulanibacillus camelliae]GGE43932.1 stage V sporulation protein R [Pullulanibacillus camelliae]